MFLNRPISGSLNSSLRAKVTLSVVLPLVLILGSFTTIEYARQREAALRNLSLLASQTGQVIEDSVQYEMLSRNLAGVQNTLDAVGRGETVQAVYLLDISGRVVFASDDKIVGVVMSNRDPTCQPCHRLPAAGRPSSIVVTLPEGRRVFRSMNPIDNRTACQVCHDADERLLGLLLTDISMAPFEARLAADLREHLLWWVATILVTVLVVNLAISRFVVRRLEGFAAAIADLRQGQLPSPLPEMEPDEIGQLTSAFNVMARQVEARDSENRALAESLQHQSVQRGELLKRLITAQEDERKRVARELHDVLGQRLAGLTLRAEAMERLITSDPDRALEQLDQIRTLSTQTTDRMYDLIFYLRPSALDDLGLTAALRAHADSFLAGTGIDFTLETRDMTDRLPPELETALYRTFQEALSNVVRHAGATWVRVVLVQRDGFFEGEIVDDGRGFDPHVVDMDGRSPHGLGLLGIRERVTQCGGELEIISRPGSGTQLRIHIPLVEGHCG
jgi:signal transduction histidine kinase